MPSSSSSSLALQLKAITTPSSQFTFHTNLTSTTSSEELTAHPCGVLHATKFTTLVNNGASTKKGRTTDPNSASRTREEHAFIWIENKHHEKGLETVIKHLHQYGFANSNDDNEEGNRNKMVFVPYSDLESWLIRYPHACKLFVMSCVFPNILFWSYGVSLECAIMIVYSFGMWLVSLAVEEGGDIIDYAPVVLSLIFDLS